MNKTEFIEAVACKADLPKTQASKTLEAMVEVISEALKQDESVTLMGFGTFSTRHQDARKGRNPRTNEVIEIAARKNPVFKAGKALKDAVS